MKIAIITGNTSPNSGLGRFSKEVVQELRNQGEEIVVLSESGDSDINIESHTKIGSIFRNLITARKAVRKINVVHALDAWPFAIYGLFAVIGTQKKLYISSVGTYSVPPRHFSLKRFLMRSAYRRASHIFCISAYTQKRISERLPFKCSMSVVYLATTPLPKSDAHAISDIRVRYHITPDMRVVLTVGGIKDRKGQLDTLRAVIEVREKRPDLVYVIVGDISDSAYIDEIKKEAKKHDAENAYRIVSNASSDKELAAWYSIADVFALTSNTKGNHFEGFGLVFLEAAHFGVPGVGTTDCGIEDAIINNETGLLVAQRDTHAIALAILKILSNHQLFSMKVRTFASKFSWQATVERYRSVYYN